MREQDSRTALLLGKGATERLARCRVAVFGLGGVGGFAVEALVRAGVGALDLVDPDCVGVTDINRQLFATHRTVGLAKVDVAAARIAEIAPDCVVRTHKVFFLPETEREFDFSAFDYVIDAIDTVAGKLALARCAFACGTPIVSAMGAGNKLDPTRFEVADVFETSVCPLARTMRRELRRLGIPRLKVVFSTEPPIAPRHGAEQPVPTDGRRSVPGSVSFVPPVVGFLLAGEAIKDLVGV